MRAATFRMVLTTVLAAAVACDSDDRADAAPPQTNTNPTPDAGASDAPASNDASVRTKCSSTGWCETDLPDPDLTFRSMWPLEARAFATAESPTAGFKVLEWDAASGKWQYIDDNLGNQNALAKYIANIWAPNDNEVYYALAPGTIVHGVRAAPGAAWAWASYRLEDRSPIHQDPGHHPESHDYPLDLLSGARQPTLGVWGIGGDVYAWYTNSIYHWSSVDGGPPSFVAEYTADDAVSDPTLSQYEDLLALSATGANKDDVWFAFIRTNMAWPVPSACPVLVRKTPSGYERVADGVVGNPRCTEARPNTLWIGPQRGWFTDLHALGVGQISGILGGRELVRVSAKPDGYALDRSVIMSIGTAQDWDSQLYPFFASLYPLEPQRFWISGTGLRGAGLAILGKDVWEPSTSYQVSTLSITGAPVEGSLYQIRGTSDTNLWVFGARHALHKTTP